MFKVLRMPSWSASLLVQHGMPRRPLTSELPACIALLSPWSCTWLPPWLADGLGLHHRDAPWCLPLVGCKDADRLHCVLQMSVMCVVGDECSVKVKESKNELAVARECNCWSCVRLAAARVWRAEADLSVRHCPVRAEGDWQAPCEWGLQSLIVVFKKSVLLYLSEVCSMLLWGTYR